MKENLHTELGGNDFDPSEYLIVERDSCDKFHHFMRSVFHHPAHIKHLKDLRSEIGVENDKRNQEQGTPQDESIE
jgi:hypothetical protein